MLQILLLRGSFQRAPRWTPLNASTDNVDALSFIQARERSQALSDALLHLGVSRVQSVRRLRRGDEQSWLKITFAFVCFTTNISRPADLASPSPIIRARP